MVASAARIAANRNNALLSTGPRTAEGKAQARANAVKLGLTGAGVALPNEDARRVKERFLGLQEAMGPSDDLGRVLVHKIALMSVRVERAARQETAALSLRMRHAAEEFELERLAEVDRLFESIEADPAGTRRRLLTSLEGVDKLVEGLSSVKVQLRSGHFIFWDEKTRVKVEAFFGGSGTAFPTSRTDALLQTILGNPQWLEPGEVDHLAGWSDRRDWAGAELTRMIDEEMGKLATARAAINPETLTLDRLEAADRAMFDPGPDAVLARKYEAAATRGFNRALRDFLAIENGLKESTDDRIGLDPNNFEAFSGPEHGSRRFAVPLGCSQPAFDAARDATGSKPTYKPDERELIGADDVFDTLIKEASPGRNEPKLTWTFRANEPNPVLAISAGRPIASAFCSNEPNATAAHHSLSRKVSPRSGRQNRDRARGLAHPVGSSTIRNQPF